MLDKILAAFAAAAFYLMARRRPLSRIRLQLWGRRQYRRCRLVEASLLAVSQMKDGCRKIVCDVPTLQKRAAIVVDEKTAKRYQADLEAVRKKTGEETWLSVALEQYKVEGRTYLLSAQARPQNAVYLASAQKEKEADARCRTAVEIGHALLAVGAVVGFASAVAGLLLAVAGEIVLRLNAPFAGVREWETACKLNPRPANPQIEMADEYPEDYAQWSGAAKYLYEFAAKYGEDMSFTEGGPPKDIGKVAEQAEKTSVPEVGSESCQTQACDASEEATNRGVDRPPRPNAPAGQTSDAPVPSFSRGFRQTRYAGKKKNAFDAAMQGQDPLCGQGG